MLANSAQQALKLLIEEEPHLILSDYDMPGMNGFDFRQAILRNPKFREIPFVFLTSHTNNSLMLEGLNLEALDYINKDTPLPVLFPSLAIL